MIWSAMFGVAFGVIARVARLRGALALFAGALFGLAIQLVMSAVVPPFEVEMVHHTDGTHTAMIDFNLAYNPYCAYRPHSSCPIPPVENTLPVAISAGERTYHEGR